MSTIKIGLLGCGNIGCGVYKLLRDYSKEMEKLQGKAFSVSRILVRDTNKTRAEDVPKELLTQDYTLVTDNKDIDLVVECMGGVTPATEYMLRALKNGKTVVTANKMAVALNWDKFQQAADEGGTGLYYEAAVGGAMPIIRMLNGSLLANHISSIKAIINGTTNYILSRMSDEGLEYKDVLSDAQRLGFAEPDPTADVEGEDAAYKLSILASLAFHARIPVRYVKAQGITAISQLDILGAKNWGYAIKLLAMANREGNTVDVRVSPALVPLSHPIASVKGPFNAVYLNGHACGDMMVYGRGAGSAPTASAIVSDVLCAVERGKPQQPPFNNLKDELDSQITLADDRIRAFYMRLLVRDDIGILAHVTGKLTQAGVSVRAILQPESKCAHCAQITILTHPSSQRAVERAVALFDKEIVTLQTLLPVEE